MSLEIKTAPDVVKFGLEEFYLEMYFEMIFQ